MGFRVPVRALLLPALRPGDELTVGLPGVYFLQVINCKYFCKTIVTLLLPSLGGNTDDRSTKVFTAVRVLSSLK